VYIISNIHFKSSDSWRSWKVLKSPQVSSNALQSINLYSEIICNGNAVEVSHLKFAVMKLNVTCKQGEFLTLN